MTGSILRQPRSERITLRGHRVPLFILIMPRTGCQSAILTCRAAHDIVAANGLAAAARPPAARTQAHLRPPARAGAVGGWAGTSGLRAALGAPGRAVGGVPPGTGLGLPDRD